MLIAHAQLPTFVAVAELLNLSAAAKKLGITQTGATQRINTCAHHTMFPIELERAIRPASGESRKSRKANP